MDFSIRKSDGVAGDKHGEIYSLSTGVSSIEVWPFLGFNCLRWNQRCDDILYRSADFDANPVPTRSGHPILFPFPNRMRGGKFTFNGREYQLPLNDSSGPNAIHGFTPKNAWRVLDASFGGESAWITGEFCLSQDLPSASDFWPADARIRVTYHLFADKLRVETAIDAADGKEMPFGLGFHPYFNLGGGMAEWKLRTNAGMLWEAQANLPSGRTLAVPFDRDFRTERAIGTTVLDTLYGDLDSRLPLATLKGHRGTLTVNADNSFRELLLFTPPHRQAIAIEPYTCTTDAANLQAHGIDCGWRVLPGGETYTSAVEYRFEPAR